MYSLDRTPIEIDMLKEELLRTLMVNRNNHMKLYETAWAMYVSQSVALLHKRIAAFESGNPGANLVFDLVAPKSYKADYDMAIDMVARHAGETCHLTAPVYRALVLDKWDWSDAFRSAVRRLAAHLLKDEAVAKSEDTDE